MALRRATSDGKAAGWRTYARTWQQAQVHRGTTADQVASKLRNHILPAFEGRAIASVRPSEVQAWVRDRSDVLAPAMVEVVYRYLAAIFAAAVHDSPDRPVTVHRHQAPAAGSVGAAASHHR
ncbi:MAG TPA: hypothetical protein VK975_00010 [Acidimicrobiales bacterium]|nr:hypothetical protein [Acidimicrobiales bacterium]